MLMIKNNDNLFFKYNNLKKPNFYEKLEYDEDIFYAQSKRIFINFIN